MRHATARIVSLPVIVLLVFSATLVIANPSILAAGPFCTTTYSSSSPPPTSLVISSPGTYCFDPGTYNTQITVTVSNVALTTTPGLMLGQAIIEPTAPIAQTSVDPATNTPEYNIILVGGGTSSLTGVTISNLVVDGSLASSTFTSCADDFEGVLFLSASGAISDSTVQNVYLPVSLAGCQPGNAIEVQTASGLSSSVTISHNQALNYNKNGITCNDAGTTCTIDDNTVSFYSAYANYIAGNGIQIGFGAVGRVTRNAVNGNECNVPTVCGPNYVTQTQSAGILTYQSGSGTVLDSNTVYGNDIGICTDGDSVALTNNAVQNNRYEGIFLNDGTYTASNNRVSDGNVGIAVVSDGLVDNPTAANLAGNHFIGTFSTAQVQAVAYTGSPSGGSYSEPVNLTVMPGFSETITAGSSATPSFVNINTLGS